MRSTHNYFAIDVLGTPDLLAIRAALEQVVVDM